MWKPVLKLANILCITLLLASHGQSAADAESKLYVLFVLDTDDKTIGTSVQVDETNMTAFLSNGIPKERLEITVLKGNQITPANIRDYYAKLHKKLSPQDAILFYYSGHGGADVRKGHFLATKEDLLYRSELVQMITKGKLPCRLAVILTDCCANVSKPGVAKYGAGKYEALCNRLFFEEKGIVDWNACKIGQFAIGRKTIGGVFTYSFVTQCYEIASFDKTVGWKDLFPKVVGATEKLTDKQQTPQDMSANLSGPKRGIHIVMLPLLPVIAVEDNNDRPPLTVLKVTAKTEAARAGIREGDVLLEIDGRSMNYAQYKEYRRQKEGELVPFTIAVRCGCGCGKLHKDCGTSCKWNDKFGEDVKKCEGN